MGTEDTSGRSGYKRPPVAHQFKPGKSGNPKGRPKGRPNLADIVKSALERKVKVKIGGKSQRIPAAKAILHAVSAKSAAGESAARKALDLLLDMTGHSKAITNEAYEKHTLRLPDSFTNEEHDFLKAPARERERQWCERQADVEEQCYSNSATSAAIRAGDEMVTQDKLFDALERYSEAISSCKTELGFDPNNQIVQAEFRRAVGRIGLLADEHLLRGDFSRALEVAELAAAEGSSKFWIMPEYKYDQPITNTQWIRAVRAHACMLLGRTDEAQHFYTSFSSKRNLVETSWETSILRDFVRLRKAGHSHPLMGTIEALLTDQGWNLSLVNHNISAPQLSGEDSVFVQTHADDVKAGDLLLSVNKPHEAIEAYLVALKKWTANLSQQPDRSDWQERVAEAAGRIVSAIQLQFKSGRFYSSVEYAERAVAIAPRVLPLQLTRACAVMLSGRTEEARALFLNHRGGKIADQPWDDAVAAKFTELREIGCGRPLMVELKTLFAASTAPSVVHYDVANDENTAIGRNIRVDDPALSNASDLHSGNRLFAADHLEEALAVYLRRLKECTSLIATDRANTQVLDDNGILPRKISDVAFAFVLRDEPAKGLAAIESCLKILPFGINPLLAVRRAHALLFLGRENEANDIYRAYAGKIAERERTVEQLIADDFAILRSVGLTLPLGIGDEFNRTNQIVTRP